MSDVDPRILDLVKKRLQAKMSPLLEDQMRRGDTARAALEQQEVHGATPVRRAPPIATPMLNTEAEREEWQDVPAIANLEPQGQGVAGLSPQGRIEPDLPSAERGVEGVVQPDAPPPGLMRKVRAAVGGIMPKQIAPAPGPDISTLDPAAQQAILQRLARENPELLRQLMAGGGKDPAGEAGGL